MAKNFIYLVALALTVAGFGRPASAEDSLNADLNKILNSFDTNKPRFDPGNPPPLKNVFNANGGTLVFFDNTQSSGVKAGIDGLTGKKKSNFISDTLAKAKARLFGEQNRPAPKQPEVFSRLKTAQPAEAASAAPTGPRVMTLAYDGPKTIAAIPPDTYVEVPFVRHIPYFFSRIEILANDTISVTETIQRVVAPEETNFTGIDRYFGKYHTDRAGKKHRTDITVLEAAIDGVPANAALKPSSSGVRLSLHQESPLSAGVHVFTVTYLFANKIAEFENEKSDSDNFKELIWNVTGQHWDMPVTRAGASIIYPRGAKVFSRTALTGNMNKPQHDVRIRRDNENDTAITLTYPLAPYEGMIVVTNWAESDAAPVYNAKFDRFLREHGTALMSFLAFLFVCSYYWATWISLKKNQVPASTQALPVKKDDLTPAVVYYALHKQTVPKTLFIMLLDMAGKGFLSFEEDNGRLSLIKRTDSLKSLSTLEKALAKKLFSGDATEFKLTSAGALKLMRLLNIVDRKTRREYKSKFITFHQTYFWFGILMTVLSVAAVASLSLFVQTTGLTALFCIICFVPLYFAGKALFERLKKGCWTHSRRALIVPFLTAGVFATALAQGLYWFGVETTGLTAFWFSATLVCIAVFYSLLQLPSVLGKSLMENMDGYKIYLSSQDDTLLATMRSADRKIRALYAKHLPFAVALGVDRLWNKRFAAFAGGDAKLAPDWYAGKIPFDENFTDALFTAFATVFPAPKQTAKKRIHNSGKRVS